MTSDPITDEIRAIRKQLAAQCGNDLTRIFAELRQREASDGHTYVTLAPRRPLESLPAHVVPAELRSESAIRE